MSVVDEHELCELYRWGMEVWMICAFYDIHKRTMTAALRKHNVPTRRSGRGPSLNLTSTRRRRPEAAVQGHDPFEDAYQSVREHARALLDRRIAQHQADGSIRFCLVEVFEHRFVSARNGSHLLTLE